MIPTVCVIILAQKPLVMLKLQYSKSHSPTGWEIIMHNHFEMSLMLTFTQNNIILIAGVPGGKPYGK